MLDKEQTQSIALVFTAVAQFVRDTADPAELRKDGLLIAEAKLRIPSTGETFSVSYALAQNELTGNPMLVGVEFHSISNASETGECDCPKCRALRGCTDGATQEPATVTEPAPDWFASAFSGDNPTTL